jgi:hypothetical protein
VNEAALFRAYGVDPDHHESTETVGGRQRPPDGPDPLRLARRHAYLFGTAREAVRDVERHRAPEPVR